jgi:hypothetical protein
LAAAAAASVFLRQREEILAAGDIILFPSMGKSVFSFFTVNRGAYIESRGDFRGAIWGYDSRISYIPTSKQALIITQ